MGKDERKNPIIPIDRSSPEPVLTQWRNGEVVGIIGRNERGKSSLHKVPFQIPSQNPGYIGFY